MSITALYRMRKGWNIELTSCDVGIVSITGAVVTIVFVSPVPPTYTLALETGETG